MNLYFTRDAEGYVLWNGKPVYNKYLGVFESPRPDFFAEALREWISIPTCICSSLNMGEMLKIDFLKGHPVKAKKISRGNDD